MSENPLHKVKEFFTKRNQKETFKENFKVEEENLSKDKEEITELLKRQSTSSVISIHSEAIDIIMAVKPIEQPIFIDRS